MVRVLIADDHPLILASWRRTVEHEPGMEVVGEGRSGPEVLELVERARPDLVVMDLRMPGGDGLELIAEIGRRAPAAKTIVVSAEDDPATTEAVLRAGAVTYVPKTVRTDLGLVLRQVAATLAGSA